MELKKCSKCGEVKEIEEFHKNTTRKNGKSSYCKKCFNRIISESYHKNQCNREKAIEKAKRWHANNPEKVLEKNRKQRSELRSSYIRPLLHRACGIEYDDIIPQLIEAKREQLKAIRLLAKWREVRT